MTARVLPTEPGPWHVEVSGVAIVVNVRARNWRGEPDGFLAWIGGEAEPCDVEHERFVWLAPVAPVGSVPPEVYARDVREAFDGGIYTARGLDATDEPDTDDEWCDANMPAVVAHTLTRYGLTPNEAARVVAGVAP